ncbi:MAG: hypothetical protein WDN30_16010 [Pararobbsia sp.]
MFRFNGQAPIITLRAENNVQVNASLTDGFFQIANPVSPGSSFQVYAPNPADALSNAMALYNAYQGYYYNGEGKTDRHTAVVLWTERRS